MPLTTLDPRYSLRARIAIIVASLTLTLSVVLTIIAGQIGGQQLEQNIGQNLSQISSTVVGQLDQVMFERGREIRITAFQSALFASDDNAPSVRTLLNQLKVTYRYYAWIGWANPSGNVVAATDSFLEGKSVGDQPWFKQALASGAPYIGDLRAEPQLDSYVQDTDGRPLRYIDIAMPIYNPQGTLLGVLGATLDWRFMWEQLVTVEQQFAKENGIATAPQPILSNLGVALSQFARQNVINPPSQRALDVLVVSSDGTVLIGPQGLMSPPSSTTPAKLTLQSVQAAHGGQPGYVIENWPDNQDTYLTGYDPDTGYRGFPGLGWIVLTRERADLALASVTQLQGLLLAIGVLSALVFSMIGWFLAIQITRPLVRVVQLAHDIKTGDIHDTSPILIGRADEVSVLSNAIDRLLVSLNSRNAQLTELNSSLEQRIESRTVELAASQRFNEQIVGTVPDTIYIYDLPQGHLVYINQAIQGLIGYTADELLTARPAPITMQGDDLKTYLDNRERLVHSKDGELIEQIYRVKHRNGQWLWIRCREAVFARAADGTVTQLFGVAQDITLRKQAEEKLQEAAAAQERQRLARELHDSVSQTLFSATMIAQTLPLLLDRGENVVKKNLDELSRLTSGALAEMRTLLNELRPAAIETADLSDLLNQLLDAARGRTKAECTIVFEGDGSLPPDVQVAVYRVAQEALNNVTKHARARRVRVRLTRGDGQLEMIIKDDGRGFKPEQSPADHFGLGIMQERAQEVGADVTIESQPGRGTEVRFTWRAHETARLQPQGEML